MQLAYCSTTAILINSTELVSNKYFMGRYLQQLWQLASNKLHYKR